MDIARRWIWAYLVVLLSAAPVALANDNLSIKSQADYAAAMQALDDNELIVLQPSQPPRTTINVFIDTSCTFNKALHHEMQKLVSERIKVRYIAFPRAGRESPDYAELTDVWCHADRPQALSMAYANKTPPAAQCTHPVDTHYGLAKSLNVRITPTIIFEDGQRVHGYQNALALLDYIDYGTLPKDSEAFCWGQETPQPVSPIRALLRRELISSGLARASLDIIDIAPTPLVDMYESYVGPYKFVLSNDGSFAMRAYIMELDEAATISRAGKRAIRRQTMRFLDEKSTIVFPADGEQRGVLTVFTDIDCPFCARFHEDIGRLNMAGIKVRYLAFPRAGIGSPAYKKMASVWCHKNQKNALSRALKNEPLDIDVCRNNPVEWQYMLGRGLDIWGTPTLILNNGAARTGYMSPESILKAMTQ